MRKLLVTILAVMVLAAGLAVAPASAAAADHSNQALTQLDARHPLCTNAIFLRKQPVVRALAKRVKVSYDQALTWVCQGRSGAEIVFAYRVSKLAGVSMDQIFTQRSQGMNWNSIATFYDLRNRPGWSNLQSYWMWTRDNNNHLMLIH